MIACGFSPASISQEACVYQIWYAVGLNGMPLSLPPAPRLGFRILLSAIPSFLADPNHAGISFNGSESSSFADAIRGAPVGAISDQPQARGPGRAQA